MNEISNLNYVIIVAGGSGTRMQSIVPKQFILLNGLPVVMHTMLAFQESVSAPFIILVLHPDYHQYWNTLCTEHHFSVPHFLAAGGETRFHSVKNGLSLIDADDCIVAVHDAVRPLTSARIIDHSFSQASANGNAIVAVKSRDSVRQLKDGSSVSLLREDIWLVQTPQTFQISQLRQAYQLPYSPAFTDDASVVEQSGRKIYLVEGDYQNIKITFPEDHIIAETLLKKNSHLPKKDGY